MSSDTLSDPSLTLIYKWEVGGGAPYYNRFLIHPEWPEGDSGVTVGVGYDLGYSSADDIRQDWSRLDDSRIDRLAEVAGITGQQAKNILHTVRDISISWPDAKGVFEERDIPKNIAMTRRAFPGWDGLRDNAQGALVSLVFNRGTSMTGDSRREMRAIRSLVPDQDYNGIAQQLRNMCRLWPSTPGLVNRRKDEARLVLTP